ncbi:tRNA (adenosine(37)-N6)-threonylcarbamoyltransferase complex dimerization subunit type 1 TsaB [Fodinibius sediminis]|uniref:tRNA threonylcarbamoyladenosine biosynthesis protein TsaB n=1 Tax=Fodinibius sediminis TaxID=1214077 RepID=A0A521E0Q4_9BACT|nr:tRNA (adenosine(37)-N6)-threonylcarbamoyltransferase complex dimerization subunit type 1 TsaB [Fodinibius sediminis]SMO76901.1 tRNA threonylcarbamoyladenosine biosynthesis protein TsaB [Fodinibius sediminis]
MLLAIETATNVCSVAFCNERGKLFEKRIEKRGAHSEQLFLFIEELMEEHQFRLQDLSAMLISEGPGSYTGLRIGASAVKGLLFQTEVPLYGVNTLAAFAMKAVTEENQRRGAIHCIIDARRVHVYHQQFQLAGAELKAEDDVKVIPIETFEDRISRGDMLIGTGLGRISEDAMEKVHTYGSEAITAQSLIRLYQKGVTCFYRQVAPESFDPRYYTSNQVR